MLSNNKTLQQCHTQGHQCMLSSRALAKALPHVSSAHSQQHQGHCNHTASALHSAAQHSTAQHSTAQHSTAQPQPGLAVPAAQLHTVAGQPQQEASNTLLLLLLLAAAAAACYC
jgi:hypothetical protein